MVSTALPPGLPLSPREQGFAWFAKPYELLIEGASKYGERFTLRIPGWGETIVVVSDPAAIREVFTASPTDLLGGPAHACLEPVLGKASLFLLDGESHLGERRMLLPSFNGLRLRAYGQLITAITQQICSGWPTGKPFPMQDALLALSLEVMLQVLFGREITEPRSMRLRHALAAVLRAIRTSVSYAAAYSSAASPYRVAANELRTALAAECASRREGLQRHREDVLHLLLDSRHEDGSAPSEDELYSQLITLLIAGHETTATALTWALLHLAQHRPALERLRFDVEDVGAPEDVARRPYLSAVVDETLRIRPVVPVVSRKTSRALSIAGMGLPEGAMIAPCIYLAHRRAARFPEPEAFRPERFIGQEYSPFEYLPFGGGVRRCLGYGLALFEMKLVLAELVQRFDFEIAERAVGRPVRRTIIVAPSGGVRMVLRRRESAVA